MYISKICYLLILWKLLPGMSLSSSKSHLGSTPWVEVPLIGLPEFSSTHQQTPVDLWHCARVHFPSGVQLGIKIPSSGLSSSCSRDDCLSVRQSFGSVGNKRLSLVWLLEDYTMHTGNGMQQQEGRYICFSQVSLHSILSCNNKYSYTSYMFQSSWYENNHFMYTRRVIHRVINC